MNPHLQGASEGCKMGRDLVLYQLFTHADSSSANYRDDNIDAKNQGGAAAAIGEKLFQLPYVAGVAKWVWPAAGGLEAGLKPPLVSPSSKYVAVLHQATVTILSKVDNFKDPIGICRGASKVEAFSHGVWLEELDMVVVVSSQRSLHYLNVTGQEVDSLILPNWKGSGPICGVFALHSSSEKGYEVVVLTMDGMLHHTHKADKYDAATLSAVQWSAKKQHPQGMSGFHFHAGQSLLALVGPSQARSKNISTGGVSVSLWNLSHGPQLFWSNLGEQQSGRVSQWLPSSKQSPANKPIVRVSPSAGLVAVIDGSGRLHVLSKKQGKMEEVELGKEGEVSSWDMDIIDDVEWMSEDAVMVARHDGAVNEVQLPSLVTLLDDVPPPFSPGCRLARGAKGQTYVLDHLPVIEDAEPGEITSRDKKSEQKMVRDWRLSSIVERSKEEMFWIKIKEGNYEAALQLAHKYGLDVDEVHKARWATSDFGRSALRENLAKLRDRKWVVRECLTRVYPTQETMTTLLVYGLMETDPYRREEGVGGDDDETWWFRLHRLRLLQHKDRLDTFLGMHNGRYFPKEYSHFRSANLQTVACEYAEGGRIAALDVLFKRHRYSLAPSVLTILDAIPETLPPHSYSKLLPEVTPPRAFLVRGENDWVESRKTVAKLNTGSHVLDDELEEVSLMASTEHMVKLVQGLLWPSESEVTNWYRVRAQTIDRISGQLENSLSLLDWGQQKGVKGLNPLFEDVSDLIKVVLTSDNSEDSKVEVALDEWELLDEYGKFQMMLQGVQADSVVDRLREQALPFLHRHHRRASSTASPKFPAGVSPVLATWLRDMAQQNKLELCAAVFDEASSAPDGNDFFESEYEMVGVAVDCVYLCPALDQWPLMKNILSRFAHNLDSPGKDAGGAHLEDLPLRGRLRKGIVSRFRSSVSSKPPTDAEAEVGSHRANLTTPGDPRLRQAEARVESGQLLSHYQVETPMKFLVSCEEDVKGTKQLLRTLLSKFSRRQPARSDSEWMVMWHDLCTLQEKVFPFLEKEYLLAELCRGLLQAGKFSLAKNHLTGTGSMSLRADKAEKLVLDTARDFFFSAPSLDSPAIEMARNCLALASKSKAVTAEENMIEAVTVKLPMLGVTILPLEFRQVKDSMDVVRMALSAHSDAYLNLPELMELAMLLGLDSPSDMAKVEAAIAREAAAAGDFDLARDLCLALVKKGHGAIWDLCAALARGPEMKSIDLQSRKELLGFALAHCDEESVGELLVAWKDADLLDECHKLGLPIATHTNQEAMYSSFMDGSQESGSGKGASLLEEGRQTLFSVTVSDESNWALHTMEHRRLASFACFQVPWLLKTTSSEEELRDTQSKEDMCHALARECSNPSSFAAGLIVYGLASYDLVWSDHLVMKLAHEALRSVSKHGDKVGCGYLMNIKDAHMGAEVLEQEVGRRQDYEESVQAMHMARLYAAVQDASLRSSLPCERREILLSSLSSLSGSAKQGTGSSRWTHRRVRTEEKLREMGQARTLERMIPGADFGRFAEGDQEYIAEKILELVGPCTKKTSLSEVLALADQYSVDRWQVLMRHLDTLFQSDMATEDEIASFLRRYEQQLLQRPEALLDALIPTVYSGLDGVNKKRLCHFYQVIADCSTALEKAGDYKGQKKSDYWRTVGSECLEASKVAEDLDFKHIAGVESVNHSLALKEILHHVNGSNVGQLALTIDHLHGFAAGGYYPSSEEVYMAFVGKVLGCAFADGSQNELASDKQVETIASLKDRYNACCDHMDHLSAEDMLRLVETILQKSFAICDEADEEDNQEALISLLGLLTRAFGDAEGSLRSRQQAWKEQISWEQVKALHICCKVFLQLVTEKRVRERKGWQVVKGVIHTGALLRSADANMKFLKHMVSAGCSLRAVVAVVDSLVAENLVGGKMRLGENTEGKASTREEEGQSHGTKMASPSQDNEHDILDMYLQIVESALMNMTEGSGRDSLIAVLTSLASHGEGTDFEEGDARGQNLQHETRQVVWQRLSEFAHDLQVPPRVRINVLELQEAFRLGELEGSDGLSLSWGDWDSGSKEQAGGVAGGHEMFQSQSSLAALKSSETVSLLWPGRQVTSEDLATVDAATTLFTDLLADASTREHVLALKSLLVEWDAIFVAEPTKTKVEEESEGWAEPEEGEGWDDCEDVIVVHALHSCWATTLQRLAVGGCMKEALQVLDGALAHPSAALLTQGEAEELISSVGARNALSGLKLALLLPYSRLQFSALSVVEEEIKHGSPTDLKEPVRGRFHEETADCEKSQTLDEEVIGLLLSAGLLPAVAGDAKLALLFAALCKVLGSLAWRLQEHQLELLCGSRTTQQDSPLYLLAFPLVVAELARARLYPIAGALVLQFMRVPPALIVWNAAYVALKQYLDILCESDISAQLSVGEICSTSYLPYTMEHLASLAKEVPRAGLAVLVKDLKPL